MVEKDYEKKYLENKKKMKEFHRNLKDSKEIQELYHKIMGSNIQEEKYENEISKIIKVDNNI